MIDTARLRQLLVNRAILYRLIRSFFADRDVLEVETPILSQAGNTDPAIESFVTTAPFARWLRTSPEFFHKRLLVAGSGSIFELAKVFRTGETSPRHNPEFTLLEWYRPGFDEFQLIDELLQLLQDALKAFGFAPWREQRLTYAELFQRHLALDPHHESLAELQRRTAEIGVMGQHRRDDCLDLLRTHLIEPALDQQQLTVVYDFPASQAALARIKPGPPALARRFEVFAGSLELANGYFELSDAVEQRARFVHDLQRRAATGNALPAIDEHLLAALERGMPDCAGVALGIDRLLMLLTASKSIDGVLAFPYQLA